jgi:hypothetical protein
MVIHRNLSQAKTIFIYLLARFLLMTFECVFRRTFSFYEILNPTTCIYGKVFFFQSRIHICYINNVINIFSDFTVSMYQINFMFKPTYFMLKGLKLIIINYNMYGFIYNKYILYNGLSNYIRNKVIKLCIEFIICHEK